MIQAHVFISGFVQGVGFRYFVQKNAEKLGLTGWGCNMPDGRVEVLLQGSKEAIEKMVELCHKGPFLAEVKEVVVEWEDKKEKFNSFEVLST